MYIDDVEYGRVAGARHQVFRSYSSENEATRAGWPERSNLDPIVHLLI